MYKVLLAIFFYSGTRVIIATLSTTSARSPYETRNSLTFRYCNILKMWDSQMLQPGDDLRKRLFESTTKSIDKHEGITVSKGDFVERETDQRLPDMRPASSLLSIRVAFIQILLCVDILICFAIYQKFSGSVLIFSSQQLLAVVGWDLLPYRMTTLQWEFQVIPRWWVNIKIVVQCKSMKSCTLQTRIKCDLCL